MSATIARTQLPLFQPASAWRAPVEWPRWAGARRVCIDVETRDPELQRLGPGVRRGGKIVGVALALDSGFRGYWPIAHEGGGNLEAGHVLDYFRHEAAVYEGEVVGAELAYDLDYLAEVGVAFKRAAWFSDVLIAEALLDENQWYYNLDATAKRRIGTGKELELLTRAAADWGLRDARAELWRLPAALVGPYAEGDVDRPLRVLAEQEKLIARDGLEEVWDLERRLTPLLVRMRRRGVRIDVARLEETIRRFEAERDAAVAEARRLAGRRVEIWAPETFAAALAADGVYLPRTPKTNKPSVGKATLEEAAPRSPLAAAVWRARKLDKGAGTFLKGQIRDHLVGDRLHPTFNQTRGDAEGTISGRLSGAHPNTQFFPKRDGELAPLIRALFLPEEGETWEGQDYSQIEYRLLTAYASGRGAEAAREAYRTDPKTDFHALTVSLARRDPQHKPTRTRFKNVNFCKVYGGGTDKVAITMGVSREEAERFVAEYDRALPFVKHTFNKFMDVVETRGRAAPDHVGWLKTLLGRRRHWPDAWVSREDWRAPAYPFARAVEEYGAVRLRDARTALNALLQGGAADLMKKWMVESDAAGLFAEIGPPLLTVHDELGLSAPPGSPIPAEIARIGETCMSVGVPLLVERASGPNWWGS